MLNRGTEAHNPHSQVASGLSINKNLANEKKITLVL